MTSRGGLWENVLTFTWNLGVCGWASRYAFRNANGNEEMLMGMEYSQLLIR